jgi:hypothetical protein
VDHARAAGIEHSQALDSPIDHTTLAEHDLACNAAGECDSRITEFIAKGCGID